MGNHVKEYDILGIKVKLQANREDGIDPEEVVNLVKTEINHIKDRSSKLDRNETVILTALKIASDKLALEKDLKKDIDQLKSTAADALHFIEEVIPGQTV